MEWSYFNFNMLNIIKYYLFADSKIYCKSLKMSFDFTCVSLKNGKEHKISPILIEEKYPLVSQIKEISNLIKIEKLEEEADWLFTFLTIKFSIEIPEKKKESNGGPYENVYDLSKEVQEKIISYLHGKDVYSLLQVGLWKEAAKNVARRNWKVRRGYEENDYNIEDNVFPSIFGMGLPIFQKIWVKLGQEEIEEKLESGLEGPFPKIPPPVLVNFNKASAEVGCLLYQSSLNLDEREDDFLVLKYLKNATNRIQKLFL